MLEGCNELPAQGKMANDFRGGDVSAKAKVKILNASGRNFGGFLYL
jgi:hypothetical protein